VIEQYSGLYIVCKLRLALHYG